MARAKKEPPWQAMFRRIRCYYRSDFWYPPKPTPENLDAVEGVLGVKLPASYRAFAMEFGLGGRLFTLPTLLNLTWPPWEKPEEVWDSVVSTTRYFRDNPEDLSDLLAAEIGQRMVVFGNDEGQETFIFAPTEVTDGRSHECRIYSIARFGDVELIAESFVEWLRWIEAGYRLDHEEPEKYEPTYRIVVKPDSTGPNPIPYERRIGRQKQDPDEADAKRWLAWNNGTIGALARSIRDEGRPEAFGILADALDEAGCTHEDLLHSCRAGDPDIDGAWVLAVLLGRDG